MDWHAHGILGSYVWSNRTEQGPQISRKVDQILLERDLLGYSFAVRAWIGCTKVNRRKVIRLDCIAPAHTLEIARPYGYFMPLTPQSLDRFMVKFRFRPRHRSLQSRAS